MNSSQGEFKGYLKFYGPSVDEGRIDIEKIGISLIALSRLYKKYAKSEDSRAVSLKLGEIKKNCTEANIFFEQVIPIVKPVVNASTLLIGAKVADYFGLTEFGKQFFGTLGQQVALKLFSKGKKIEKIKDVIEEGKVFTLSKNYEGKEKKFSKEIFDSQKEFSVLLDDLVQLEKAKEEKLEIGYYEKNSSLKVAEIRVDQKEFFNVDDNLSLENRLAEEFDESKAQNIKIVGKFVDYFGMAQKYHFSFQARKNQEEIGKQKILCKTEGLNISEIIDYLKPEKQESNVCIFGKATKSNDGKIDKIKIAWINENEDYNPDQEKLF